MNSITTLDPENHAEQVAFSRERVFDAIRSRFAKVWKARSPRKLRVAETVTLGEHRILAVVECGNQRFLIGGSSATVVLLACLNSNGEEVSCP
jgi:hypothetical protein